MPLLPKVIIDQPVACKKSLRLANRFELSHLSLLLPRFLM
jgi:hypothetical protein